MAIKAYKGQIAYTKSPDSFEFIENGYVVVDGANRRDGCAGAPGSV